jgi:hypothetical protein
MGVKRKKKRIIYLPCNKVFAGHSQDSDGKAGPGGHQVESRVYQMLPPGAEWSRQRKGRQSAQTELLVYWGRSGRCWPCKQAAHLKQPGKVILGGRKAERA